MQVSRAFGPHGIWDVIIGHKVVNPVKLQSIVLSSQLNRAYKAFYNLVLQ